MKQAGVEVAWHHFVGLDLGQRRDPSAAVDVERVEILLDEKDRVTCQRRRAWRYRVRFVERMRLETPYPDVVARVREVLRCGDLAGRCTLVTDATGVGAPVVDMFRRANLRCGMEAVIITGGERESYRGRMWSVPKNDLVKGLKAMLEKAELELSNTVPGVDALVQELVNMEARGNGRGRVSFGAGRANDHDDLAMALALACWRARRGRTHLRPD